MLWTGNLVGFSAISRYVVEHDNAVVDSGAMGSRDVPAAGEGANTTDIEKVYIFNKICAIVFQSPGDVFFDDDLYTQMDATPKTLHLRTLT